MANFPVTKRVCKLWSRVRWGLDVEKSSSGDGPAAQGRRYRCPRLWRGKGERLNMLGPYSPKPRCYSGAPGKRWEAPPLRFVCYRVTSGVAAVQMLTGPTPTLTNWITYRPGLETGPCTLAIPLGAEVTVPSILPLGSITMSLYGKLASDSATTENPSAFEGTMR